MRYPIMRRRDDNAARPRKRLRIPVALAVAFVGSASAISMWYGGCTHGSTDPAPDTLHIDNRQDALPVDAALDADDVTDATDAPRDSGVDATPDGPPPQ